MSTQLTNTATGNPANRNHQQGAPSMTDISSMEIDNTPVTRSPVWRLDELGAPVRLEPGQEDPEYQGRKVVPPRGSYTLKVAGIAEKQNEPNRFHKPEDPRSRPYVDKTWIEFEIVQGRNLTGRWFSNKWTWSLNDRSTMGKFVLAMLGTDPPERYNVLHLLGNEFEAMINPKSDTYAELLVETVMPKPGDDVAEPATGQITAPQPTTITESQKRSITTTARGLWGLKNAQGMLLMFLHHGSGVDELDSLTYDQAEEVQNLLETDPEAVTQFVLDEEKKADPLSDVPE